jgi:hypothetical protein
VWGDGRGPQEFVSVPSHARSEPGTSEVQGERGGTAEIRGGTPLSVDRPNAARSPADTKRPIRIIFHIEHYRDPIGFSLLPFSIIP